MYTPVVNPTRPRHHILLHTHVQWTFVWHAGTIYYIHIYNVRMYIWHAGTIYYYIDIIQCTYIWHAGTATYRPRIKFVTAVNQFRVCILLKLIGTDCRIITNLKSTVYTPALNPTRMP